VAASSARPRRFDRMIPWDPEHHQLYRVLQMNSPRDEEYPLSTRLGRGGPEGTVRRLPAPPERAAVPGVPRPEVTGADAVGWRHPGVTPRLGLPVPLFGRRSAPSRPAREERRTFPYRSCDRGASTPATERCRRLVNRGLRAIAARVPRVIEVFPATGCGRRRVAGALGAGAAECASRTFGRVSARSSPSHRGARPHPLRHDRGAAGNRWHPRPTRRRRRPIRYDGNGWRGPGPADASQRQTSTRRRPCRGGAAWACSPLGPLGRGPRRERPASRGGPPRSPMCR